MNAVEYEHFENTCLAELEAKRQQTAEILMLTQASSLEVEKYHARRRAWLLAFFRDEPEYERNLSAWIREMESLHPTQPDT